MDEHTPCPLCRRDNPPENRFCGRCGASLVGSKQLVPRRENSPDTVARTLPAKLEPAAKALAVGLTTLAAEAGLLWLRRRVGRVDQPPPSTGRSPKPVIPEYLIGQSLEEVSIWLREGDSQRRVFARRVVRSFATTQRINW